MSLSIDQNLQPVTLVDPRVRINEGKQYSVYRGGNQVSWKPVISRSFNNSNIQWTAPPPSPGIVIDRRILMKVKFRLTVRDVGDPTHLPAPIPPQIFKCFDFSGFDSPRAFPLSQAIETLAVTINNTQVAVNMRDSINALLHYYTPQDEREYYYSSTPSMLDQYQNYHDCKDNQGATPFPQQSGGEVRNPLVQYGTCYEQSRGGFPLTVVKNDVTEGIVEFEVTEPVFLSPFLFGNHTSVGFLGVQSMDWNVTLSSDLSRIWSHMQPSPITPNPPGPDIPAESRKNWFTTGVSVLAEVIGEPTLLFNYINPPLLFEIPKTLTLPYYIIDRYQTETKDSGISAGSPFSISSSNIQLQTIPRRMYIYANRKRRAATFATSQNFATSDTFAGITGISINFNNASGLLSSASEQDLWKMSVDNGCKISWGQWHLAPVPLPVSPAIVVGPNANRTGGYVGSVLCIDFGKDIGLADDLAPGLLGTYQLQMSVQMVNNNNKESVEYTLTICTVTEGSFSILENRSVSQVGVISKKDVLTAPNMSEKLDMRSVQSLYGGNFFTGLKEWLHERKPSSSYGSGGSISGGSDGGMMKKKKKKGGVVVGGKMLSRSELRDRLRAL